MRSGGSERGRGGRATPRKIVEENIQLLTDFINLTLGDKGPTERHTSKNHSCLAWGRDQRCPSDVWRGAPGRCPDYARSPLKDGKGPSIGHSMDLTGREIERQGQFWKLSAAKPKLGARLERGRRISKRKDRGGL